MSAREKILKAIAANKPSLLSLPVLPLAPLDTERFVKIQKFRTVLEGIGGKVFEIADLGEAKSHLLKCRENGLSVACLYEPLGEGNISINPDQTALELESIDTAFVAASFGVAENGSVWLFESAIVNRLLPFICQHLVIILDAGAIVSEMHEAYRSVRVDEEGYGLFLAGPSKTADIEQSLVIGAHGARSATVYLINNQVT